MTPWWQGRMAAFDIESTGLNVDEARIVTATITHVGGGVVPVTLQLLVNPGIEIPAEATAVHGVTTEQARAEGEPPADALRAICRAVTIAVDHGYPLVAFNAPFDLTILERECRRHGIEFPSLGTVLDPLVMDKHLDPYRQGSRRLEAVCAHYDAEIGGAHNSMHDALAAARVAYRIGQRTELGRMSPDALHRAQAKWSREQRLSFAAYKRGQGDTETAERIEAEVGWPVLAPKVTA